MADFNARSDSVNVEQIMEQIRARIREKRGVDYTEEQIRELAAVKLQKFLDPRGVRSDLLDQFRKSQPPYEPPNLPNYAFEEDTLFESHRGMLRVVRTLLRPILKLFFNPNPLIQALNIQARLNTMMAEREARREASERATQSLYYELIHNLVLETTRLGIEVKNLTMRVESLSSRLEFNERRARALESVVIYQSSPEETVGEARTPQAGSREPHGRQPVPHLYAGPQGAAGGHNLPRPAAEGSQQGGPRGEGPGQRSRRRRRRRGRRGAGSAAALMLPPGTPPSSTATTGAGGVMPSDPNAPVTLPSDARTEPPLGPSGASAQSAQPGPGGTRQDTPARPERAPGTLQQDRDEQPAEVRPRNEPGHPEPDDRDEPQ